MRRTQQLKHVIPNNANPRPAVLLAIALFFVTCQLLPNLAQADEFTKAQAKIDALIKEVLLPSHIKSSCGVTRRELPILTMLDPDALKLRGPGPNSTTKTRILLVGGIDGSSQSAIGVLEAWRNFYLNPKYAKLRTKIALAAVPMVNVEEWVKSEGNLKRNNAKPISFPAKGSAYGDANPESIYLWRWIGTLAPDVVVRVNANSQVAWTSNGSLRMPTAKSQPGSFLHALKMDSPLGVGAMLGIEVGIKPAGDTWIQQLLDEIAALKPAASYSKAHQELVRRAKRTPLQTAQELSKTYGHSLPNVAYIPSLALLGRLRIAELDGNTQHTKDVEKIVAPYVEGTKQALAKRVSGSTLSGHLIFSELARRTGNKAYLNLAKAAADLGFDDKGALKKSMPFHSEMSDAVFMGTPILVQTGRLLGDTKYFDMADRHLKFMTKLNRRKDGLHQHSPLGKDSTAWGRGNGFVALGLALSLSDLPKDSPHRSSMLKNFQDHIAAMVKHQDEMGMWHQVVDRPESYRELTVTCMTTFSIVRGVRNGWLDRKTYLPVIQRAWHGISRRIGSDGVLVDVCTGTGKQRSLREYFDRPAIFGKDSRGGAMSLMVTTELAASKLPL
jgi:unsaturated rhamnogalacturonyl hydrolase